MRTDELNTEKFLEQLASRETESEVTEQEYSMKRWTIDIPDAVGDAYMEQDADESSYFNWSLTFGPVNSSKLITYLHTLDEEPDSPIIMPTNADYANGVENENRIRDLAKRVWPDERILWIDHNEDSAIMAGDSLQETLIELTLKGADKVDLRRHLFDMVLEELAGIGPTYQLVKANGETQQLREDFKTMHGMERRACQERAMFEREVRTLQNQVTELEARLAAVASKAPEQSA